MMSEDAKRIEKIMKSENLTNQKDFAVEIGLPNSSNLSQIFSGRQNPSLQLLRKIQKRFPNISADWLFSGEGQMYRQKTNSQSTELFANEEEITYQSVPYVAEKPLKTVQENSAKENDVPIYQREQEKLLQNQPASSTPPPVFVPPLLPNSKLVEKIILYYSDKTYQEFLP